jgi:tight adherence protein B
MLQFFQGNHFLVLLVLTFVAIILLIEGLYMSWQSYKGPQAKKLHRRLQRLSASPDRSARAGLLKQRMLSELPLLDRILLSLPRVRRLDSLLLQSGLDWSVSKLLFASFILGAVGVMATTMLHQSALFVVLVSAPLAAVPLLYVLRKRSRRLTKLEQQLPDALDLMTRALRSGHAFSSGLKMVGDEMAEPLAGEFRSVHDEVNFGVSLEQALMNLSDRVPITDLRYFVVAVMVQRESGGNLTEILANLSRLIRERLKLMAKVRVLSSEGRMSAWILGLMPFALAAVVNLVNPEFMQPLWTDPIGISIVKYMLVLMVIGVVILRKIVRIRI